MDVKYKVEDAVVRYIFKNLTDEYSEALKDTYKEPNDFVLRKEVSDVYTKLMNNSRIQKFFSMYFDQQEELEDERKKRYREEEQLQLK